MRGVPFLERFEIIEELGAGGFAKVFRCYDLKMEREVAIKQVPKGPRSDLRTMREISTTALLNHPNIVTLYEFLEDENDFFLIMEYIDGLALSWVLEAEGPLLAEEAVAIASQVALALEYAHQNEIIHRDIKPDNIMLLADGRIKVMDFGIARLKGAPALTVEKSFLGTLGYVSPEQAKGDFVDEAADIFALGALVYTMLAGENPFEAETAAATIYKIINIDPPPISSVVKGLPKELDRIIDEALAKDPDKRQRTITSLRYKLERLLEAPLRPERTLRPLFARAKEAEIDYPEGGLFDEEVAFIKDGLSGLQGARPLLLARVSGSLIVFLSLFTSLGESRFYSPDLKLILSLVCALVVLVSPLFGLGLAAFVGATLLAAHSFALSLLFLALSLIYLFKVARAWPEEAVFFLAAPILGRFSLAPLFPPVAGVLFNPLPAAVSGAAGGFALEVWSLFSLQSGFLAEFEGLSNPFLALVRIFGASPGAPAFLLRPLLWGGSSFLVALLAKKKRFLADLIAVGLGFALILLGEIWLPGLGGKEPLSFGAALQKLSFSFIILIIFLFLFHYIKIARQS